MTKLKMSIIGAVVIAGVATPVLFHRAKARLASDNAALRLQLDALSGENTRLSNLLAQANRVPSPPPQATDELLRLRAEVARMRADVQELAQLKAQRNGASEQSEAAARSWLSRLDQLKQRLEVTPHAKIPEFQFLTEEDWLRAARGQLNTEDDYRRAFAKLRSAAEGKVAPIYKKALDRFLQDNDKRFPTDLAQLKPYFDQPLDDAILQRWDVVPAKTVESLVMGGDWVISQTQPVDDVFDSRYGIGPHGWGSTDFSSRASKAATAALFDAYKNANNGRTPEDPSLLSPYVTTPEQKTALENLILRRVQEK